MKTMTIRDVQKSLDDCYEQWDHLYQYGGQDPFWPDGVNLNLVRNHIVYYKQLLIELQTSAEEEQLSLFSCALTTDNRPVPPEVDDNYMAQTELIRTNAIQTYHRLQEDPATQYILSVKGVGAIEEKQLHKSAFINYFRTLESAINQDDFVAMRRYQNAEYWIAVFQKKAQDIRVYLQDSAKELEKGRVNMSNWCSTNITFYSEKKDPIVLLEAVLRDLEENPSRVENDFGNLWLGNVLDIHGIDWHNEPCRGKITRFDEVEEKAGYWTLEVEQEDAWEPKTEMWEKILSTCKEYEGVQFACRGFEPGDGLYYISDPTGSFYPGRYMVDAYFPNPGGEEIYLSEQEYMDEESLLRDLSEVSGGKVFSSVNEACQYFQDALCDEEDAYFSLYVVQKGEER